MVFIINVATEDSRIFDGEAVSEIGQKSEFMSAMGEVFGTGITFASFHWVGTCTWQIEALKMADTGVASSREKDFRSQFGRESGSGALEVFNALKHDSTLNMEIV